MYQSLSFLSDDVKSRRLMLACEIPLDKWCRARFIPESNRGELGTKMFPLQFAILILVIEWNRFSRKCRLDFQSLNAGIGTGVTVVFCPLSDTFELTMTSKLVHSIFLGWHLCHCTARTIGTVVWYCRYRGGRTEGNWQQFLNRIE